MSGTSFSRKTSTKEESRVQRRERRSEDPATTVLENTFYKIVFSNETTLEDKVKQVTKALEFTNNKEEDRAKIKEFDAFKEFLQSISEEMSKQRIQMTDTETFSELQRVYGGFNDDLNKFIELIQPLTDITDALYKLRQSGETRNVLAQIAENKELDLKDNNEIANINEQILALDNEIAVLVAQNLTLKEKRSFFGFGDIKADAKSKIAANEIQIENYKEEIGAKQSAKAALESSIQSRKTIFNESFEAQKLQELLDLTTEEHTQRQANMVASALKFVTEGKERFGAIRGHLDKITSQIEGLGDNNGNMIQIYAIMNDATKKAEESHKSRRAQLEEKAKTGNLVEDMQHEEEKRNLDDHIDTVSTASIDTMQAYAELTTEAIKIRNMQAATKRQSESARAMHSRGIASVASQLSVVVTAVNSAAINESQAMASNTLSEMAKVTNNIAQKEAIRIATGRDDVNYELEAMLQSLAEFGDTQKEATSITREALATMRANLDEMERLAKDVQEDTDAFRAVAGDVISDSKKDTEQKPAKPAFKF